MTPIEVTIDGVVYRCYPARAEGERAGVLSYVVAGVGIVSIDLATKRIVDVTAVRASAEIVLRRLAPIILAARGA